MIDLAAARAVCEGATEGPWVAELDVFNSEDGIVASVSNARTELLFSAGTDFGIDTTPLNAPWTQERSDRRDAEWAKAKESQELRDARFIASARTLLPQALDEISRLRALVVEACDMTEGVLESADRGLECVRDADDRLAAMRAQVEEGK
jgi:hypothetical protein